MVASLGGIWCIIWTMRGLSTQSACPERFAPVLPAGAFSCDVRPYRRDLLTALFGPLGWISSVLHRFCLDQPELVLAIS